MRLSRSRLAKLWRGRTRRDASYRPRLHELEPRVVPSAALDLGGVTDERCPWSSSCPG
jgi:hypothetical protein